MIIPATVLMLLLASCATSPEVVTKTETVVPVLSFPEPPDPTGHIDVSADGETVHVDTRFWVELAEYMVDVEAVEQQYHIYRRTYESDDD